MGIALVIVGGLVLMTLFAAGSDYLSKQSKHKQTFEGNKIAELEGRIKFLEEQNLDKDQRVKTLETELGFLSKLIEDKRE